MELLALVSTQIRCSPWLRRQLSETPLWRIWWTMLICWLIFFPATLLVLHQLVLYSWMPEVGFLHSWSLSYGVLVGDSILSLALATLMTLQIADYRHGQVLLLGWMRAEWAPSLIVTTSAWTVYWFLLVRNQRPPNDYVIHQYAWVFDAYHWLIGTLVASYLTYGLLTAITALMRRPARSYRTMYLVVPLLIGLYFQVALSDKPAYRVETNVRIGGQYWSPVTNRLFTYPGLEGMDVVLNDSE